MTLVRRAGTSVPAWTLVAGLLPLALMAVPVGYLAVRAGQAGPSGIVSDLIRPYTLGLLRNTLVLATLVTALSTTIAVAAAWLTERCALPGAIGWRLATTLPLAMPAYVSSFAWSSLGPWFQEMPGAVLVLTLYSVPLVYLPAVAALRSLEPGFEDVARSLGTGRWGSFRRVVLPQMAPAIGGGALLVVTHMFAEFGALAFLRVETFTTAIYDQYANEFNREAAALLSGVLVLLAMPAALGEAALRTSRQRARLGRGAVRTPDRIALGRWKLVAMSGLALLAILGFVVPLVTLVGWMWIGRSTGTGLDALLAALMTTAEFGLGGAVLTTLLAVPLVVAAAHHGGRFTNLADRLPYLVHGLPGIVVALSAVSIALAFAPNFYQSTLLVMLVYTVLFLPLAQSAIRASADLVPAALGDVARSLGKPPLIAFLLAILPNLLPGIGAALALSTLQMMRELTATLLLAPAGTATLATEFWAYTSDRAYGAAAPFALALVLVSGLPVALFTARSLATGAAR